MPQGDAVRTRTGPGMSKPQNIRAPVQLFQPCGAEKKAVEAKTIQSR